MNGESSSLLPNFECPICLDIDLISIATLNCQHRYHLSCLSEWDKKRRTIVGRDKSVHLECPNCMTLREIVMITVVKLNYGTK